MKNLNNPLWGAKEYDSHWGKYNSPRREFEYETQIIKLVEHYFNDKQKDLYTHTSNIKMIDIGCGIGRLMYKLSLQGFNCEGIDISPVAIKRLKETYPNLKAEVKDATKEDFSNYDLAIVTEVIEHLEDDLCLKLPKNWIASVPNGDTIAKSHMRSYLPEDIKSRFNAEIFYIGKWIIFGNLNNEP